MEYTFERGRMNVHYLTAPYELLVKALGNDGTVSRRDSYKSMCEWDVDTPSGVVEVYDYKVGTCYSDDGLARESITVWHIQGHDTGIDHIMGLLDGAGGSRIV